MNPSNGEPSDWRIPTDYGLVIYTKEYCDRHFNQDNIYYYRSAKGGKDRFQKKWAGEIIFLSYYGEQTRFQLSDWAVNFKISRNKDPNTLLRI